MLTIDQVGEADLPELMPMLRPTAISTGWIRPTSG